MAAAFTLEQVFFVGRKTPVDATGTDLPALYREVLECFGRSSSAAGCGFCGDLKVLAPDELAPVLLELDEGARSRGEARFFGPLIAPNFAKLFTADDAASLKLLAYSGNAEYLVTLPGLDELFFVPSPRSGQDIVVCGTDMLAALTYYARRRDIEVPYFIGGEGVTHARLRDPNSAPDWTSVFSNHAGADRICEGTWSYFFDRANAVVTVTRSSKGVELVVTSGADASTLDEFLAWLRAFIATPDLSDPDA